MIKITVFGTLYEKKNQDKKISNFRSEKYMKITKKGKIDLAKN